MESENRELLQVLEQYPDEVENRNKGREFYTKGGNQFKFYRPNKTFSESIFQSWVSAFATKEPASCSP